MDERTRRTMRLLLFLTVQVVSLAVLEHQQQTESQHPMVVTGPSVSNQMLIPVLAMWESMHTTAILTYLKHRNSSRNGVGEDGDAEDSSDGNGRKKRKREAAEKDRLASVIVSSSKAMQVAFSEHIQCHIVSHALNSDMDRIQRKDQSNRLVSVLGDLADVMRIIAEKL